MRTQARIAGLLYLVSSIFGVFALLYVPSKLIVPGNPTATAAAIRGSEELFRVGIASEIIGSAMFVFVALALYRLLERVDRRQALTMLILILLSIPISFIGAAVEMAALMLYRGVSFVSAFDRQQLDALAFFFLRIHHYGIVVASVFWGLWLVPLGLLVIRSHFIPRVLGYLLIAAAFGYLIDSANAVLYAEPPALVGNIASVLEALELPTIFWLLIWGVQLRPKREPLERHYGRAT